VVSGAHPGQPSSLQASNQTWTGNSAASEKDLLKKTAVSILQQAML
jgi:hypothetical protein